MAVQKVNVNGVVYDVEDKEGVEANAQKINNIKSGAEAAGIAHKLASGMVYRGYVNEGTTLPLDDNSFYFTNDPGNYIDSKGNAVTVTTEGVSLIQRKNGEWKVYALWELVSELNNASSTRFASAKAVKTLKDMIDQLAAFGDGEGTIPIDSKLSLESIYPVQNTVITAALNELGKAIEAATDKILKLEQDVFPLEITLTVSPSAAQEYTGSNEDFTISWTMKIAGETVLPSKLELKVGNDVVPVDIEDVSKIVSVNNDKQVTLIVEADGRAATKTANINFARRYYSAVVDSSWTATNDTVKALAKSALKSAAAATVAYSAATQKKIVFAYPVSHGVMSTIKDAYGNSMFALNDSGKTFNTAPKTVAVTLSGGATLDYYVYESVITNVTAGNITYTTKTFD